MIYVNRNTISIPLIFDSEQIHVARKRVEEFYSASASSRRQERFNSPFEREVIKAVRESVKILFKDKCAYCESPIPPASTTGYVDNFRPKNGARGFDKEFANEYYWWLMYEWGNLYYSCHNCDRFKSTWFPVEGKRVKVETPYFELIKKEKNLLIDPCNDRPEEHLVYKKDGRIDFLSLKGKSTIDILKLNRSDLVVARKQAVKELSSQFEEFLRLWKNQLRNKSKLQGIAKDWDILVSDNSFKPYSAIQRQMLSQWLHNHLDIQQYLSQQEYEVLQEAAVLEDITAESINEAEVAKYNKRELDEEQKKEIEKTIELISFSHIYLEKIELHNYKCFTNLQIDFTYGSIKENEVESNSPSEPWLLFLGENAVGKSSILKAISIALMGQEYIDKLSDHITVDKLLRHEAESGYIKLFLSGEEKPIVVSFSNKEKAITSTAKIPMTYLVGYGSVRLLPNKKIQPERKRSEATKVENLFDYSISLANANDWLIKIAQVKFDRAALALKDLMLLEADAQIIRNKRTNTITIQSNNGKFLIEELSDGYQSVYALAVDIMSFLVKENVTFELAEGIVLIDEIGTHLHPRWKMQVVEQLRKTFPKLQFVVSTHEPLCLRGLRNGEIVVLAKNAEQQVIAITDLPDPSEYRVDQILTSEFFGLNSTIDSKTEKLFEQYYAILATDEEKRSEAQKNDLIRLNEIIPRIKHLGDNLREELVYYVIDELLAKKVKDDGLKIKENLKQEALKRVAGLWELVSQQN